MSRRANARQLELADRYRQLCILLRNMVFREIYKGNQKPYEMQFSIEMLKARYNFMNPKVAVSQYAFKRYLEEFSLMEYIELKAETAKVVYERIQRNPYGIEFPDPKTLKTKAEDKMEKQAQKILENEQKA